MNFTKKCRKFWRRIFNNNSRKTAAAGSGGDDAEDGASQQSGQAAREVHQARPARAPRHLPTELLAELAECVPHHRLGLAKLVTSYSSCPVGLFGVHLSAQNGLSSIKLLIVSTVLTVLLMEKREKMVGPIEKWNKNELELYNKWKVENVHLITLLEEVKRLHACNDH